MILVTQAFLGTLQEVIGERNFDGFVSTKIPENINYLLLSALKLPGLCTEDVRTQTTVKFQIETVIFDSHFFLNSFNLVLKLSLTIGLQYQVMLP